MIKKKQGSQFLLCVDNRGYSVSLEVRKVYQAIADTMAEAHRLVRVIDESGEDYLYPRDCFVPIALPREAQGVFQAAS